jgi:hypothetical protein
MATHCSCCRLYLDHLTTYSSLLSLEACITAFAESTNSCSHIAGEIVSAEDLGGAAVHCFKSGLTDYFAPNELDAITKTRE